MADLKSLLLLSMLTTVASIRHSQNVIFRKTSEVTITRSRWLLVFSMNLEPYNSLLNELKKEIDEATLVGKNLENDCIGNEKGKCLNLWCPLMQDIKIMKASVEVIERYLHGFTLLQNREKRSVLPIMGKALNVLFGTITEKELDVLERRLKASEKGQLELAQVEKDSMTILNITRVELADNRRNINELVGGFKKMQVELGNITGELVTRVIKLEDCIRKYLRFLTIVDQLQKRLQALLGSIRNLQVQFDMLALGHLSPNIVEPSTLKDHLLEVQSKLPHHLRLPADPTAKLWHYYKSLGCLTLIKDDRLLIMVSLPLLDTGSIYEVFKVINLPIPYPREKQGLGTVAKYKIETENIALDQTREKFMLLTPSEAEKCKHNLLGTCVSNSPIYTFSNHHLCVMELFRDNRKGIGRHCQIEILLDVILPKAIRITDGVWAIASRDESEVSQVCTGKSPKEIKISPPLTTLQVPLGCGVYGGTITLPPYYQAEEKFETSDSFLPLINTTLISRLSLWEPLIRKFPNITLQAIPNVLSPLKKTNLRELMHKLDALREQNSPKESKRVGSSTWIILIIAISLIILSVSLTLSLIIRHCFSKLKER